MPFLSRFALGFGCVVVLGACGGSVSLGSAGAARGTDAGEATPSQNGGVDGGTGDCSDRRACGVTPHMPAITCADGTVAGNTGRCISRDGACVWEIRLCPAPAPATCFDDGREPNAAFAAGCRSSADCVAFRYEIDCCGSYRITGVTKTQVENFEKCASTVETTDRCDCIPNPTVSDLGTSAPFEGARPKVFCEQEQSKPQQSRCRTTY